MVMLAFWPFCISVGTQSQQITTEALPGSTLPLAATLCSSFARRRSLLGDGSTALNFKTGIGICVVLLNSLLMEASRHDASVVMVVMVSMLLLWYSKKPTNDRASCEERREGAFSPHTPTKMELKRGGRRSFPHFC